MKRVYIFFAVIPYLLFLCTFSRGQDTERGKDLFGRRCGGCHSLDKDKEGPHLRDVFGRKAASVPSFNYSDALKKASITWDALSLEKWLTEPADMVPETDMDFRLPEAEERKDIIAYLKHVAGK